MDHNNRIGALVTPKLLSPLEENFNLLEKYGRLLQHLSNPNTPISTQVKCIRPDDYDDQPVPQDVGAPEQKFVKRITTRFTWDGRLTVLIKQSHTGMSRSQLSALVQVLVGPSSYVDILGEAVVAAHRTEFEEVMDSFEQAAWDKGCRWESNCEADFGVSPVMGWCLCLMIPAKFVENAMAPDRYLNVNGGDMKRPDPIPKQFGRYATLLRRLSDSKCQPCLKRLPAQEATDNTTGNFSMVVRLADAKVSYAYIESMKTIFDVHQALPNMLAEAVLASRMTMVERFVAGIPTEDWVSETMAFMFRAWGLRLESGNKTEPVRLVFYAHLSRLSQMLNAQMLRAAMDFRR